MRWLMLAAAALVGYFVASLNPAIILSRAVYRKDIRELGSKNPGFTNFKRCFGMRWAIPVFVLDLLKAAFAVALFSYLLPKFGFDRRFAAIFTGFFCMLGHAYPPLYGFRGGKGFLVCLSAFFVTDWRVGLICFGLMCLLLFTTHYMSLSTVTAILAAPLLLVPFGASYAVFAVGEACAVFMAVRHRENIRRLLRGEESRFYFGHGRDKNA